MLFTRTLKPAPFEFSVLKHWVHPSQMVAATSRVFGNEWDGGVTAYTTDQQQKSCHLPSGCTSISFVGASSEAVALSCDDGNVVVLSLSSLGEEGWRPLQMFADHENMVSAVRSCPVDANILVSGSVDQTVKVWSLSGDEGDCLTTLRGTFNSYLTSLSRFHAHTHEASK